MRSILAAVGLAVVMGPGIVRAAGELDLDEVVAEALKRNPEILAAQKRYEGMRQRPAQAGSLPDPVVSMGYTSNGNPLPGAGLGVYPTSNIGVQVSQQFFYPGKRRLREEAAGKDAEAEFENYQAVELNVVSRVKQAFYRYQHSYAAEAVLEEGRDIYRRLLEVAEARYAAGKAAQQDVFKSQTRVSLIETKLMQLRQEQATEAAEINALLDRPAEAELGRPAEPHAHAPALRLDELETRGRKDAPELKRDEKLLQSSELKWNLAGRDYYPDTTITAGYFNQHPMAPMYVFRADVNVPLYFFRKQRAALAERGDGVAEARHTLEADAREIGFRIREQYLAATTAYEILTAYEGTVIPQAKLALNSSLIAYQTGAVDMMSVLTNADGVVELEMGYHEQMQGFHTALSRLEELTGMKLSE